MCQANVMIRGRDQRQSDVAVTVSDVTIECENSQFSPFNLLFCLK